MAREHAKRIHDRVATEIEVRQQRDIAQADASVDVDEMAREGSGCNAHIDGGGIWTRALGAARTATGDDEDEGLTIGDGGGGAGSDGHTRDAVGTCTAGVGSENVDDASVRLAVQSRGAGDVGRAGNDGLGRRGSRSAGWVRGVEHMLISSSLLIRSARGEYEDVGDDDVILDVLSRRSGDAGRTGGDGTGRGVSQSA